MNFEWIAIFSLLCIIVILLKELDDIKRLRARMNRLELKLIKLNSDSPNLSDGIKLMSEELKVYE